MYILYFVIFVFILTYFLIRIQLKRREIERDFGHIPSPKEMSGIGNILLFKKRSLTEANELLEKITPEPITKVTFAGYVAFVSYDPEICKQILLSTSFLERPFVFGFFKLEHGLVSAYYKNWKPVRMALNKTVSQASILGMMEKLNKHADRLVTKFEWFLDDEKFDVINVCMRYGMEQVFDTMLETEFKADYHDGHMIQEINEVTCARSFYLLYYPDWIFRWTDLHKRAQAWHDYMKLILRSIIEKRKFDEHLNSEKINTKPTFVQELQRIAYRDKTVPKQAMMDNLKLIVLAGAEPLSIAIANVLTMLAIHPEIDKKVYEEIQQFYKEDIPLYSEYLKNFEYLDRVVQETNRLFTVIPGTVRDAMFDTYIRGIGLIPKGTTVGLIYSKMHRDPKIWGPNANKFDPDHFLPEKVAERHPYSYLPFSGGARSCFGRHYGILALKIALIKVLANFKFTTQAKMEDIIFRFSLVMKIENKFGMQVNRR